MCAPINHMDVVGHDDVEPHFICTADRHEIYTLIVLMPIPPKLMPIQINI